MKSIQHVLWRGALALSLMAVGIGSGIGMPPVEQATAPADCTLEARTLVADATGNGHARDRGTTLIVLRRALTPAG